MNEIKFKDPNGLEHKFFAPSLDEKGKPVKEFVECTCGKSHGVFKDPLEFGVTIGYIKPEVYKPDCTNVYYYSLKNWRLEQLFPGSKI